MGNFGCVALFAQVRCENKATQSKFAISFRRRKSSPSLGANQQALLHDQTSHYRNYAHGPGLLRHRPPARKRKDSLDPARAVRCKRLVVFSSSARRHPGIFFGAISRRETAHRRPLIHTQLPEIFRGSRGRNRFVSSTRSTRPLLPRALRLQDPRKQERQRSPRRAIRSPTLQQRLRNPESSTRDLRERTARQSRAAFRRSPPRSSPCRSRLAQFS